MSLRFRAGTPADRDAILKLRSTAFPTDDGLKMRSDWWEWEFRRSYAGPAATLLAVSQDEVIGHIAFLPQHYHVDGKALHGALACDAMVHPNQQGRGVFPRLMREAAAFASDRFDLVNAFQIRPAVLPGMLQGGWRVHSAHRIHLRPLSVRALLTRATPLREDAFAAPEESTLHVASEIAAAAAWNSLLPRTQDFLAWRTSAPGVATSVTLADDRAYVIHRDVVLRGVPTLAILDAAHRDGHSHVLRDLLRRVLRAATLRRLHLAAMLLSPGHPLHRLLLTAGFLPGPHRFQLLVQTFRGTTMNETPHLTWMETDHV